MVIVNHAVIEPAIHHLVDLQAGMLRGVPGIERIESRCEFSLSPGLRERRQSAETEQVFEGTVMGSMAKADRRRRGGISEQAMLAHVPGAACTCILP